MKPIFFAKAFYRTGAVLCFLFTLSFCPLFFTSFASLSTLPIPFPALGPDAAIKEKNSFISSDGDRGSIVRWWGGTWLAWTRGFRRLPCCKVTVIMSRLTVADFAFEVQMSFPSIHKSPFRCLFAYEIIQKKKKKVLTHSKYYPSVNIDLSVDSDGLEWVRFP